MKVSHNQSRLQHVNSGPNYNGEYINSDPTYNGEYVSSDPNMMENTKTVTLHIMEKKYSHLINNR